MSIPQHVAKNLVSYAWILVLPIIGWFGLIVFLKQIHILSAISLIFGLIAFTWAFALVIDLLGKGFCWKWAYLEYLAYLGVLVCWGVSSSSWYVNNFQLLVASVVAITINAVVTLLLSWFITELKYRQN